MDDNEKNAKVFKAFCDPNRLKILKLLQNGEKCACELLEELKIGQPTLSHHMKILCDSGIVTGRREGKWTYYSFDRDGVKNARNLMYDITSFNENAKTSLCD
ncbi:MAG: metalloregulator ArsR/SmtB family transcription factor [Clostridia bacterium]|nr:metalloregulator ArsR/SmtB family transcription factor [Clostridia bacterium]